MKWFKFHVYDNDSYLLEVSKVDRHRYDTCNTCGLILNKRTLIESQLPSFNLKKTKHTISGSYDGFKAVSQDFKDLYEASKWKGLKFYAIPRNKDFYLVVCSEKVALNKSKSAVLLEDKCDDCGHYMGVYMKGFASIDADDIGKMESSTFYRSSLEFGHDFEQGYNLFASEEVTNALIEQKLLSKKDLIEVVSVD